MLLHAEIHFYWVTFPDWLAALATLVVALAACAVIHLALRTRGAKRG